ncbi:MAG: glycosyltransferase [Sphingomonas sp.]
MKILLVHNNKMRWADTFRAEEFKKHWTTDEVDIVNRWNLPDGSKYDVIHFLYSGGITKSKDYILKNKEKVFTSLASQRTFDFMFDTKEDLIEVYSQTRCCVAQNRQLLESYKKIVGKDNVVYIPNGVDENLFKPEFVAGFVGAKDSWEHKGYHIAKQACDDLGIRFEVAKEHDYDHETMPEFYKKIDVLLIPSLSEGCHNPTLEALAMNIPVISTDVGIADELDGVFLVERNIPMIKEGLRFFKDRSQILGNEQVLEEYTWKNISDQYRKLYV